MNVLFLSSWFPHPANNGSKLRIYNLLRALAERHDVTLASFCEPCVAPQLDGLLGICCVAGVVPAAVFNRGSLRALLGFFSPWPRHVVDTYSVEFQRLVRKVLVGGNDDVVVCDGGTMQYLQGAHRRPTVCDDIELITIRDLYTSSASARKRFRNWLTWQKTRRYTADLANRCVVCSVVSEQERAVFMQVAPGYDRVHVVPNGVDTTLMEPGLVPPRPNTLIYSGALTYSANYDAMRYFLGDIWPYIKRQEPSASLAITGGTDGVDLSGLAMGDGVSLTGYLPDIRPAVAGAWATVVPLRIGAGTRLKILESMALGTPVVATSKGAEGLEVAHEENILIADGADQFSTQVVRLLRDPILRQRLAENGRRLVVSKYDWSAIGRRFVDLVEYAARARQVA